MKFRWLDIEMAIQYVSSHDYSNEALLCKENGKIYYQSEMDSFDDLGERPPEDVALIQIPSWQDFDLGNRLVRKFAQRQMPGDYEHIQDIFRAKGAYGRFKSFLVKRGRLDDWHEFENNAQEQAIRDWCEENGIELKD